MIPSFVTWLWKEPGHRRQFQAEYVNVLAAMIARHYPLPHRVICITDERSGLDSSIEVLPLPGILHNLRSPHGPRFPSCYRRLWNFSREAAPLLGPLIVGLDIDVVICGDLRPLVDRPESFVGWTDARDSWANKIAGGAYLLRTGSHPKVWESFDPATSPARAAAMGLTGSDQAWMSLCLYPPPGRWTAADGVLSIKWMKPGLPVYARLVSTPGDLKPWSPELQQLYPWIKDHWRC